MVGMARGQSVAEGLDESTDGESGPSEWAMPATAGGATRMGLIDGLTGTGWGIGHRCGGGLRHDRGTSQRVRTTASYG